MRVRPVVSVSGGKDSTATYLLCLEQTGGDFDAVFADTGNEHEATYEYVARLFERHRQSQKRPDDITRDVLEQLLEKQISPVDAALKLEAEGLPLPESLRLLLAKAEPEPPATDDGAYSVIPPEEMAERARQRREEAARQQEVFVKTRAAEVEELKTEMGGGSFQPQADSDGEKHS